MILCILVVGSAFGVRFGSAFASAATTAFLFDGFAVLIDEWGGVVDGEVRFLGFFRFLREVFGEFEDGCLVAFFGEVYGPTGVVGVDLVPLDDLWFRPGHVFEFVGVDVVAVGFVGVEREAVHRERVGDADINSLSGGEFDADERGTLCRKEFGCDAWVDDELGAFDIRMVDDRCEFAERGVCDGSGSLDESATAAGWTIGEVLRLH